MASRKSLLDRRELMAGLGAAAARPGMALDRRRLRRARRWRCRPRPAPSRSAPGAPETPVWSLGGTGTAFQARRRRSKSRFGNELPVPARLNWRGLDGVPAAEPLTAARAAGRRGQGNPAIPLRHAGTFLCDLGLLGDGQARPSRGAGAGGRGKRAGRRRSRRGASDRGLAAARRRHRDRARAPIPRIRRRFYTINGRPSLDIPARSNERLQTSLHQRLPTHCHRYEIGRSRRPGHGHRQPAGRAVPGAQRRAGAGAGQPGRRLRRCDSAAGLDLIDPPARRQGGPPDRPADRLAATRRSAPRRCRRRRRCRPTACRRGSTSRTRSRIDLALGGPQPTG